MDAWNRQRGYVDWAVEALQGTPEVRSELFPDTQCTDFVWRHLSEGFRTWRNGWRDVLEVSNEPSPHTHLTSETVSGGELRG